MMLLMKIMKRELILFFVLLIVFLIGACGNVTPVSTVTETIVPSFTLPIPLIASTTTPFPMITPSLPTQATPQFAITSNPEQIVRWKEYEQALASRLLSYLPPDEILCEWEILGQTEREVYVWAICMGLAPAGRSEEYAPGASIPVVVHLELNGSIRSVELPRDNNASYVEGIQKMFPAVVKEKIFERSVNISEMVAHISLRRKVPSPPLIIISSTL